MDQVLAFFQNIWLQVLPLWDNLVFSVGGIFWVSEAYAQLATIAIFVYILLVIVFLKLHHGMIALQRKRIAKCVREYDRVWYYTSKAMYEFNAEMKAKWQVNQLAHGTRSVLKLDKKDYLHNRKKIFDDVKKLQTYMNKEFVPIEVLKKIKSYHIKIKSAAMLHQIVGRGLVVMTLGVYLLGWKRVYYK